MGCAILNIATFGSSAAILYHSFKTFCLLSWESIAFLKEIYSKRKEFSPLTVDPFSEGRQN